MKVIFISNFRSKTKKIVRAVFEKNIKVCHFELIWRPFREYLQIKNFFKNPAVWLFYLYSSLTSCKKSEKSLELFLRKPTNQPSNYYQQHRSIISLMPVQKWKLLKPEFMRDTSEFDWSKDGNIFDWHLKHICGMFCFDISFYCLLFILLQSLWNRACQVAQETWFCLVFTFLLQPSQKTFVTVNAKFK